MKKVFPKEMQNEVRNMRYVAVIKRRKKRKMGRGRENDREKRERESEKRKRAAKRNRVYLPMRMSCRSGAISPRLGLRSLW